MKPRVLVCCPIKSWLNPVLNQKCYDLLSTLAPGNPDLELGIFTDSSEVKGVEKRTAWSLVTVIRNAMLEKINLHAWDYLLWIDADVVYYPPNLPTSLLAANPGGVSAPLILVEWTERFYDTAAFILAGASELEPENNGHNCPGRNLTAHKPYWPSDPATEIVPMDCAGTVLCVPTSVYLAGARYEDHPRFTDHWPVCAAARQLGLAVNVHRGVIAYHANLPKYGEKWH